MIARFFHWLMIFFVPVALARAEVGELDLSFGLAGSTLTDVTPVFPADRISETATGMAALPDGKIIVAGTLGEAQLFGVSRYLANGELDESFGHGGRMVMPPNRGGTQGATAVALQADGKIVMAGYAYPDGSNVRAIRLLRCLDNGLPDPSFGTGGVVTTLAGATSEAYALAIQGDGRIVVAGYSWTGGDYDFVVARYLTDGSPDTSFNGTGVAVTPVGTGVDRARSVVVQADGKILLAGEAGGDFAAVRYLPGGTPDPTFSGDGKAVFAVGASTDVANTLALVAEGKIVLAGRSIHGETTDFSMIRLTPNGDLDQGFGNAGKVITPVGDGTDEALAVSFRNEKIVLAGLAYVGGSPRPVVARYDEDGGLDVAFGTAGKVIVPTVNSSRLNAVCVDGNGDILGAGQVYNGANNDVLLASVTAAGTMDQAFGSAGVVTTSAGGDDRSVDIVRQPDGKILVAGNTGDPSGNSYRFAVVRYLSDGRLDHAFGIAGRVVVDFGGSYYSCSAMDLLADGRIILAGNVNGVDIGILRLLADGSPDPSFGTGGKLSFYWNGLHLADVVVLPDGRILGAGQTGIFRLLPGGAFDTTFDGDGKLSFPSFSYLSTSYSVNLQNVKIQPDGKILICGLVSSGNSRIPVIYRTLANGAPDSSFGSGGRAILNLPFTAQTSSMVLAGDGKILLAGSDSGGNGLLVRCLANGSLDTTFNNTGYLQAELVGNSLENRNTLAVLWNGKIAVAWGPYYSEGADRSQPRIALYRPDGATDQGFGAAGIFTAPFGVGSSSFAGLVADGDGGLMVCGNAKNSGNDFLLARVLVDQTPAPRIVVEDETQTVLPKGALVEFPVLATVRSLTLRNTGDLPLTDIALTLGGAHAGDFEISPSALPAISPGGSAKVTVRMEPKAAGTRSATLKIASNDVPRNPFDLTLSGVGVAPVISVHPLSQTVEEGTTALLHVSATGSAPLHYQWHQGPVGTLNPVGPDKSQFTTPPQTVTQSYWVRVSNSAGFADSEAALLTSVPRKSSFTSPSSSRGRLGVPFSFQLTATESPTAFEATDLPDGLSINTATGLISGTPREEGVFVVTIAVVNAGGGTSRTLTLTIDPARPWPVIVSPLFASAGENHPFLFQLVAIEEPTGYEMLNAPSWLVLDPETGVLSGTPTVPGTVVVEVRGVNTSGRGMTKRLEIGVSPDPNAPRITSVTETRGRRNVPFSFQITTSPLATSFGIDPLPAGLQWNAATGLISGTPTVEGTFEVGILPINASGQGRSRVLKIIIGKAPEVPVVSSTSSLSANVGESFSAQVTASNSPVSFSFTGLPAGLSQTGGTGLVSGIVTTPGTYSFSVRATNGEGAGPEQTLVLTVRYHADSPVISLPFQPTGHVGIPFSYQPNVSGAPASVTISGLPEGLVLDPSTGRITGTPTLEGAYDCVLEASNSHPGKPVNLRITILANPGAPEIIGSLAEETNELSAFSYSIQASSRLDVTNYSASGLPAGLELNPITGLISGSSQETGAFPVTLTAGNAAGSSSPVVLTITVRARPDKPKITSNPSASARVGEDFSYQITASQPPFTGYSAENLPEGLLLDSSTGLITGKPVKPGDFPSALRVANAIGSSDPLTLRIQVKAGASLPQLTNFPGYLAMLENQPMSFALTASSMPGAPPWTAGTGIFVSSLPPGISINPATGVVSGAPVSLAGFIKQSDFTYVWPITVHAVNDAGQGPMVSGNLEYRIVPPAGIPNISGPTALSMTAGQSVTFQVEASDSPTLYHFDDRSNNTGLFTYSPPARLFPGVHAISLFVTNALGTRQQDVSVTLSPSPEAPVITGNDRYHFTAGEEISIQPAANKSVSQWVPSVSGDHWPPGISINQATGMISGKITAPGDHLVEINAVGAAPDHFISLEKYITITISPSPDSAAFNPLDFPGASGPPPSLPPPGPFDPPPVPVIDPDPLLMRRMSMSAPSITGQVGVPFSRTFNATGDVIRYRISGLPPGLAFNENTGKVAGEPTLPGGFEIIVVPVGLHSTGQAMSVPVRVFAAEGTPVITGNMNATATAGTPFTRAFAATANPTAFHIGGLPTWLAFDPLTGLLSGTHEIPGEVRLTVSALNAEGLGESRTFTIHVSAAADTPVLHSFPDPAGKVGQAFQMTLAAENAPQSFGASAIPYGLNLDPATGRITGIPTVPGTFYVRFWAANAQGTGGRFSTRFIISAADGAPAFTHPQTIRLLQGQALSMTLTTSPAATSLALDGLPAGWSFDSSTGLLTAAAPEPGIHRLRAEAWNAVGSSGKFTFTVAIFENDGALWLHEFFGDDADDPQTAGWQADPDGDGLNNLVERAFNLDPRVPGAYRLDPGTGTSGLPAIGFGGEDGKRLRIEYVRRTALSNPGITYRAEFSSSLESGEVPDWTAPSATGLVTPINAGWERVVVEDPSPAGEARRFGRVRITSP